MSTEKLVVEIAAKVDQAEEDIKGVKSEVDNLSKSTKKTDESFSSLGKTTKSVVSGLKVAATAAAAASASLLAASKAASQYARELSVASNRMGESVERAQELAFAANTVGISLEKLGDISKDTRERIGEFTSTGGGAFQDFVDVLGLTEEQALATAEQFQEMSGPQILQEMVRQMEEGGATAEEMSFALEGMASDTTDLIPLLRDGAKGLNNLTKEARGSLKIITAQDLENIKRVGQSLDLVANQAISVSSKVTSVMSEDILSITENIGDAFNLIGEASIFLVNGIQIAVSGGVGAITNLVREAEESFLKLRIAWNEITGDEEEATFLRQALVDLENLDEQLDQFASADLQESLDKMSEQLKAFRENPDNQIDLTPSTEGGDATGDEGDLTPADEGFIEQLAAGYEAAFELEQEQQALREERYKEHLARMRADTDVFVDALIEDFKRMDKEEVRMNQAKNKQKEADTKNYLKIAKLLGSTAFEDSKAFNAGLVVADTAVGVQRALTPAFPGAPPNVSGAAFIALQGALNLSQVLGASPGGGSVNSPSSAPAPDLTPAVAPDNEGVAPAGQTIFVEGIDRDSLVTAGNLIDVFNEAQDNGARVVIL